MRTVSTAAATAMASGLFGKRTMVAFAIPGPDVTRANRVLWSKQFQSWTRSANIAVTTNAIAGPTGLVDADLLTITSAANNALYQAIAVTPGETLICSVYAAFGTFSETNFKQALFNATAGAFIAVDIVPTPVEENGIWTRFAITVTVPAGCTSLRYYAYRNSASVGGTMYLADAQIESGTVVTPPIETTVAAVTATGPSYGVAGFWDGAYDISWGGATYHALGGNLQVSTFASGSDFAARAIDITFSGLDSSIATEVEGADWHQTPVTIYEAIIDVDSPQILNVDPWFTGFLDTLPRKETVGGSATLIARCESIARELGRKGARTRADADQRDLDPDDGFYKHAAVAGNTSILWGVRPQSAGQSRHKLFGLF